MFSGPGTRVGRKRPASAFDVVNTHLVFAWPNNPDSAAIVEIEQAQGPGQRLLWIRGHAGWASNGVTAGGQGGGIELISAAGGAGSGSLAPGAGGQINITLGAAGTGGSGNAAGGTLTVNSGAGSGTGAGGSLDFTCAAGGATGAGGSVTVTAGNAGGGNAAGGALTFTSGAGAGTGNGGGIGGTAGAGGDTSGTGAAVTWTGGAGGGTGTGGNVNLTGGAGGATDGVGGAIIVTAGAGQGTGTGGAITIDAGSSGSGTAGAITIGGTNANSVSIGRSGQTTTISGALSAGQNCALTGDLSPAQITADQNNYNPTNLATASILRLTSDAARNITGLAGGADGRVILIYNVGSNNIVLVDESASSTAANRFALDGNLTLGADTGAGLQYDSTSSRWRLFGVGKTAGGGGGTNALLDGTNHTDTVAQTVTRGSLIYGNSTPAWDELVIGGKGTWPVSDGTDVAYSTLRLIPGGRLTLTSGTAVTTADVTAATTLYYALHVHNMVPLYNSTAATYTPHAFTEQSIKLTDTQTGTTTNASAIITALTDTSQFMRGMEVTGTGIAASSTISSIDSATQVTLNNAATASGTVSLTFKLPASKNYDIFGVNVSGALKLRYSNAWTNDTTRADALTQIVGVQVNNAAINAADSNTIAANQGVYLGTVRTTATAGQTEDAEGGASQAGGHRYVWNCYNRRLRHISVIDNTNSWNYTTATWRAAGGVAATKDSTGNKVEYVAGLAEDVVVARVQCGASGSGTQHDVATGVGIDSTSANSARFYGNATINTGTHVAAYSGIPGIGLHSLNWLEQSAAVGVTTFYGDNGSTVVQAGLEAEVWA